MTTAEQSLYDEIWARKIARESDLGADGLLRTAAAEKLVDPGTRLLDVGCGEGTLAARLRGRFTEVYGIDISDSAVELARKAGIDARVANLNVDPLPFDDRFFDTVVSLDVIEHVFEPVRFVREIRRVLRPGGHAIISTPNIRKIQRIAALVRGRFPGTSYDPVGFDGGHLHYFTSRDLTDLLAGNGFHIEAVDAICGDRRTWKYRLAVRLLGRTFEREFLSHAILAKGSRAELPSP